LWLIIASVLIYVLGVIAFGGSLFLNSKPNPLKANTPNTISSKSRTGLYASAKYVQEIYGETEFQKLLKEKQHIVAVFYASWCGHCR
jgi:thiol:disulfide interchange protein